MSGDVPRPKSRIAYSRERVRENKQSEELKYIKLNLEVAWSSTQGGSLLELIAIEP